MMSSGKNEIKVGMVNVRMTIRFTPRGLTFPDGNHSNHSDLLVLNLEVGSGALLCECEEGGGNIPSKLL